MEGISSRQVLGEGTCVTTLSLSGASGETVTMYVLTLHLPIPLPSKYPTRVCFLGGGVAETRKAPSNEEAPFIGSSHLLTASQTAFQQQPSYLGRQLACASLQFR